MIMIVLSQQEITSQRNKLEQTQLRFEVENKNEMTRLKSQQLFLKDEEDRLAKLRDHLFHETKLIEQKKLSVRQISSQISYYCFNCQNFKF
jgi:hypothetical protein